MLHVWVHKTVCLHENKTQNGVNNFLRSEIGNPYSPIITESIKLFPKLRHLADHLAFMNHRIVVGRTEQYIGIDMEWKRCRLSNDVGTKMIMAFYHLLHIRTVYHNHLMLRWEKNSNMIRWWMKNLRFINAGNPTKNRGWHAVLY